MRSAGALRRVKEDRNNILHRPYSKERNILHRPYSKQRNILHRPYSKQRNILHRQYSKQRNILHGPYNEQRKANWIGHISRRNCILRQFIGGGMEGKIEVTGGRGKDVSSY